MDNLDNLPTTSVLDHGFVRLVNWMGDDLSIVRNARISYNAAWRAGEDEGSDARLINYLLKNGHNTPFEAVVFTFEVKAPIFVVRQWHRHRTQSYNEISARYKELPSEYYIPSPENIGVQSKDNKQMREPTEAVTDTANWAPLVIENNAIQCFQRYHQLLDAKVPREIARTVLPLGTYTHMFATANLHNWFNFLRERLHPHAQWEIREYAVAISTMLKDTVPVAWKAFANKHKDIIPAELLAPSDAVRHGTQPHSTLENNPSGHDPDSAQQDNPTTGYVEGECEKKTYSYMTKEEFEKLAEKRKEHPTVHVVEGDTAETVLQKISNSASAAPHHKHKDFNTNPSPTITVVHTVDGDDVKGDNLRYWPYGSQKDATAFYQYEREFLIALGYAELKQIPRDCSCKYCVDLLEHIIRRATKERLTLIIK